VIYHDLKLESDVVNKILKHFQPQHTPQSQPLAGEAQVPNNAGGYVYQLSMWDQLVRFLVLGAEGGTYYVSERKLTLENATNVQACIQADGVRVVQQIVEVSQAGRAPKNSQAIFALALCAALGDERTKAAAMSAVPQVCRIGTHIFEFTETVQTFRGWGRGLRRGVARWYTEQSARDLAYQLVKYRQREGWSHLDVLRLAHPKPTDSAQDALFKWVTHPDQAAWATADAMPNADGMKLVWAFHHVQKAQTAKQVIALIRDHDLPREALPTEWLNDADVWAALLDKMPMTAMIRNLATMSKIGLLKPLSEAEKVVTARLGDAERLRKARVHPIALLSALRVYARGFGERSDATWQPTAKVIDALNEAFYLAFSTITPSNTRTLLSLDVSGSMGGGVIAGVPGVTPRDGSAAMALVTARTEPQFDLMAFGTQYVPVNISPNERLDDVLRKTSGLGMMGTDCAQPMLYALERKLAVDTFVIYTDNETWAGKIHPKEALRQYRAKMGIAAKLIVVGMTATGFSIADPQDAGMMDVVGFDAAAPAVMSDFAAGRL
jgi:60 kDa SS-A/Ro ribonucleoprotein